MIETVGIDGIKVYITSIDKSLPSYREGEKEAVGRLVAEAFGKEAQLGHTDEGVPYIIGSPVSISVSHSREYACIAVSTTRIVGIDVEQPRTQLERVAPRVLSAEELAVYGQSPELLLRAWTLKEALYKAALTPGLDFRSQICLPLDLDSEIAVVNGKQYKIISIIADDNRTIGLVADS